MEFIKNVQYKSVKVQVKAKGRYSEAIIKEAAEFKCKLLTCCISKIVTIHAYIDEDAVAHNNIVFGQNFVKTWDSL